MEKVKDILTLCGNNINTIIFHKPSVGSASCYLSEVNKIPEYNLGVRKFYVHDKTIEFELL